MMQEYLFLIQNLVISKSKYNLTNRRIMAVCKIKRFLCLFQRERMGDRAVQVQRSFLDHLNCFAKHFVLQSYY